MCDRNLRQHIHRTSLIHLISAEGPVNRPTNSMQQALCINMHLLANSNQRYSPCIRPHPLGIVMMERLLRYPLQTTTAAYHHHTPPSPPRSQHMSVDIPLRHAGRLVHLCLSHEEEEQRLAPFMTLHWAFALHMLPRPLQLHLLHFPSHHT